MTLLPHPYPPDSSEFYSLREVDSTLMCCAQEISIGLKAIAAGYFQWQISSCEYPGTFLSVLFFLLCDKF